MGLIFEWDKDTYGRSILITRKSRGKISIAELQEEMSRDYRYEGAWVVLVRVREESYQGWGGGEEPKGDVIEFYPVNDGEDCPVCAVTFSGVDYCPHCGERVREEKADCGYCRNGDYYDVLGSPCKYNFCPMCGKYLKSSAKEDKRT